MSGNSSPPILQPLKFEFGKNWRHFLDHLNEDRISLAQKSLKSMIGLDRLEGKRFLDVGCGSGLFSLAAIRLGADEVVSFDFDQDSVNCAMSLQEKFGPFANWRIQQGDVLDSGYLEHQGKFDVVYSWGVLHHTGQMWQALDNIQHVVADGGILFISIYNDQGLISDCWRLVKKIYNVSPRLIRFLIAAFQYLTVITYRAFIGLATWKPLNEWFRGSERGMSLWHDAVDWVGGYPFETASVEELSDFFDKRGFKVVHLKRKRGVGCNEMVLKSVA